MSVHTRQFSRAFYLANLMEIFERLAWYGFFTVSSLYMTGAVERGGLGFSNAQRGVLQGIIPFFVYVLPVLTGAVADRVGYRRMFICSYVLLIPGYYLLGEARQFWPFFLAYMLVAVGAAVFKPLPVGTVARSTSDRNRSIGFGIFYLMVNVGGFVGPMLAGAVRAISWSWVFVLCSGAIAVNLVIALFFFRDPRTQAEANDGRVRAALDDARRVLGNGRFALTVSVLIVALMTAGGGWWPWRHFFLFAAVWLAAQWLWDRLASQRPSAPWYAQTTRVGNTPFLVYLLVMSLFWTAYYQIYLTFPLYVRDFVDTSDLVTLSTQWSAGFGGFLAHADVAALTRSLQSLTPSFGAVLTTEDVRTARFALAQLQVLPPLDVVADGLGKLASGADAHGLAALWVQRYRQVNPEYIVALDFLSIVLFQYFISSVAARLRVFAVLVGGTLLIAVSYFLGGVAHTLPFAGAAASSMVVVFAFGEMLASPKSQEYVAAVAPASAAALFMGYYFVSTALGLLFAGVLSGWAYQSLAIARNAPSMMWILFGLVAVVAALALFTFKLFMAPRFAQMAMVPQSHAARV